MFDILEEIWATAGRNKLRTVLTGFAVAWGIFMIIFLLGVGNGLINATEQNTGHFLANSMKVGGWRTSKAYRGMNVGRVIPLDDRDMQTTERNHGNVVRELGGTISRNNGQVAYQDNYVSGKIYGVYPNLRHINKIEMLYGRFINEVDNEHRRKTMVVSENQAKELVGDSIASLVGKMVRVDNTAFQIVGICKTDFSRMNNDFYCPFNTIRTLYNRGNNVDNIIFSFDGLGSIQENEDFEKLYKADLNANHGVAPDDDEAIWIMNRFTQNLQMNTGLSIIRTALWVIGIFTLLSGIVGVSNIMLITVKERTREFGVRKAIGASPWSILRLIIVESVIITTFFGYIGMLLGIGANAYMNATIGATKVDSGLFEMSMFVNPTVGVDVCIEATLVMIVAGTIAGLIPARRAARIKPIEALRAE